jgi:hypothetical protein
MTKRVVTVEVTEDDIRAGKQCDAEMCPIARAMVRSGLDEPIASYPLISALIPGRGRVFISTPWNIQQWMMRFDECDAGVPPVSCGPIFFVFEEQS